MASLTGADGLPVRSNATAYPSSVPIADYLGGGRTQMWNRTVSHREIWRTQPIVASTVNKIVRQIARLPIKLYEPGSEPGSKERVRTGPAARLLGLTSPAGDLPIAPIKWKQWMLLPTAVEGTGLMRKVRDKPTLPPTGLRRVDWRHASPQFEDPNVEDATSWLIADPGTRKIERFPASDIICTAWESFGRGVGVSPLEHLGTTLSINDAAEAWQVSNLSNASRPPGVVQLDDEFLGMELPDRQLLIDQATKQVRDVYSGPENAGKPLVLPPGMTWADAGFSAHDAELIRQRELSREEVCVVYDIPEVMLGLMKNATLANVEVWGRLLFTHVLGPWIVLVEETLQAQLIDIEPAFDGLQVEFELAEVLRGDTLKEVTALRLAVMAGLMTINEARATRNLPALDFPFCDEPLIPANNMRPISLAGDDSPGGDDGSDALTSAALSNLLTARDNDDAALAERLLAESTT